MHTNHSAHGPPAALITSAQLPQPAPGRPSKEGPGGRPRARRALAPSTCPACEGPPDAPAREPCGRDVLVTPGTLPGTRGLAGKAPL